MQPIVVTIGVTVETFGPYIQNYIGKYSFIETTYSISNVSTLVNRTYQKPQQNQCFYFSTLVRAVVIFPAN